MSTETDSFNFQPRAHISISRVDHSTSIMKSVDDIFQKQLFTDVCLSCENQIINAHRLILAASTSFFHSLFQQQPCCLNPNPVIVMKDIKIAELKAILEFIYFGSTTVPEDQLNSLIKSAESLGVYGLGKLNPDSINDAKDDKPSEREINNNVTDGKTAGVSKESAHKSDSSAKQFTAAGSSLNNSLNKSQSDKIKKKVVVTGKPSESDDPEEKRKKRELINLTINQNASQSTSQQSSSSNSPSRTDQSRGEQSSAEQSKVEQSAAQQAASKRQSLRIRYRKNNPDPTKDTPGGALDLNASQNSELSLSELSATNGKRLKRSDLELDGAEELRDELMSVDGSDYCIKSSPTGSQGNGEATNGNSMLVNKISIRDRTLKLKRNKNSILRKQPNDPKAYKLMLNKSDSETFGLMATRRTQLDDLQSNQVLTDDDEDNDLSYEENIVLKKLDSPAVGSQNASRKNSVDSNNELNLIKLRDRGDHNESSTSAGNQSLLAKQQSQQKKKRRRTSIDNDS